MGGLARLCLTVVVLMTAFTAGDIVNKEMVYQYDDYRKKREKRKQENEKAEDCEVVVN